MFQEINNEKYIKWLKDINIYLKDYNVCLSHFDINNKELSTWFSNDFPALHAALKISADSTFKRLDGVCPCEGLKKQRLTQLKNKWES